MKVISRSVAAMMLVLAAVACGPSTDDSDTASPDPAAEPGAEPSSDSARGKNDGATGQGTGDSASGSRNPSTSPRSSAPEHGGDNDDAPADDVPGSERRDHNVAPEYDNVLPDTGSGQSPVLDRLSGSENGKCVDTSGMRNARSGGIAAGPFDEAKEGYGRKAPGKPLKSIRVYWIPRHTAMAGLTVRVSKVGASAASTKVTEKNVADAGQWKFYDTYIPIPSPGTWKLEATSGKDRGCFRVSVE